MRDAAADATIRVLYVRDTLTVCGPGKTILNTWRTIDRSRFSLSVVATEPAAGERNVLLDSLRRFGAEPGTLAIGRGVDLVAAWRLAQLIREQRIDILQTHDAQTRRIGVIAAALTGVRHITSVHGWIFNTRKELVAKWIDARLIAQADAVVAVSDKLKSELVDAGVPGEKITLLRNAILLDDYATRDAGAALRRELGLTDDQPVLSIIGRLSLEKGHDVFLRAVRQIVNEVPETRCLIVGDGPLAGDLAARVAEYGLGEHVIFTGHKSDLSGIYGATDILVSSSFTEGIPNVLLEAYANGKPAVATAVGGVPEVLRDGETGFLVAAGDADGLAARVLMLLKNSATRERMGRAARALIERRFSFVQRTRAIEELYLATDRRQAN